MTVQAILTSFEPVVSQQFFTEMEVIFFSVFAVCSYPREIFLFLINGQTRGRCSVLRSVEENGKYYLGIE